MYRRMLIEPHRLVEAPERIKQKLGKRLCGVCLQLGDDFVSDFRELRLRPENVRCRIGALSQMVHDARREKGPYMGTILLAWSRLENLVNNLICIFRRRT